MGVSVQAQKGGQAEYIKAVKRLETCPWLFLTYSLTIKKIYPFFFSILLP
jgi:hypothetical protein